MVDDDAGNDGPNPGSRLSKERPKREKGDLAALGYDVCQHGGGEGIKGGDGSAVIDVPSPDLPGLVVAKVVCSDADAA